MNHEAWHSAIPNYDHISDEINSYQTLVPTDFFSLQTRLENTLRHFSYTKEFPKFLLINSPDNALYRTLVKDKLLGLVDDNQPVIHSERIDSFSLFGSQHKDTLSLCEQAHNGFLIVSANALLSQPKNWLDLKSLLLGYSVPKLIMSHGKVVDSCEVIESSLQLIIIGDRNQLAELDYFDDDILSGLSLFSEIELDIELTTNNVKPYFGYIHWLTEHYNLPKLSNEAIPRLLNAGARYTEDQAYMPLDIVWFIGLLSSAKVYLDNSDNLSYSALDSALDNIHYQQSFLPERALQDITSGQVLIETKGKQIGQVNGLTVIDMPGHPISYGEPARISCVVHFGDGDVHDVERKAELGGNLHAKGMMIMQAFISSALDLDEPMPFSASIVFEQSYSEVDGDSASLAELCSLVSALSDVPINQEVAVTGAVDQFGRVQAVGGVNEKIEGFYRVCHHNGLTGNQGIILPRANLKNLSLHKDVVSSIQAKQFHIWTVENVDDAVQLIMNEPFQHETEESILGKIADRIDNFLDGDAQDQNWVRKIRNWFF
ncbi:Lon protease family protein [Vibrio sp.]|nr:Lon protease family protein [Vibrio sp.]